MRQCNIYSNSIALKSGRAEVKKCWSSEAGCTMPLSHFFTSILLFFCFVLLLLSGCAKKIPPRPLPEEMTFNEYLLKLDSLKTLKFLFSIKVNRQGEEISGNASMLINEDDTTGGETVLRVYSLGFLISEIRISDGNIITEGKNLSPEKAYLLSEALRSCFLWWKMKEREVEEEDNLIIVRNSWRKVYIDKDYIPLRQEIHLPKVPPVVINYERPEFYLSTTNTPKNRRLFGDLTSAPEDKEFKNGIWFPSLITVKLQGNEISLHIEKIITGTVSR